MELTQLVSRSDDLGSYYDTKPPNPICRKAIPLTRINTEHLASQLQQNQPPSTHNGYTYDTLANQFSNVLYNCIAESRKPSPDRSAPINVLLPRWQRILKLNDDALLWKAIDWKGDFKVSHEDDHPTEAEFQFHLERLLNPPGEAARIEVTDYGTTVPVLDKRINISEVQDVINKQIKPNKSCGPDGISPGVFKFLPETWLAFLCTLLNMVFLLGYPLSWVPARLIMLFKKGWVLDCDNYRGISIINAIAKIYDYVLNNRLVQWYQPQREQAGAQQKRGCIEHIVCLRLIIDIFMRKRRKLFITFIDFSKAYDRVPRSKMFQILKSLGCGVVMLVSLVAMYAVTVSILGSTVITSSIGVRQGSPTSCFLFIIFVDVLIRLLKAQCSNEDILGWLHVLMLMDDTVILATSRETLLHKLNILSDYCMEYGMVLNETKTKFMAINGSEKDKSPISIPGITVQHCDQYIYLGVVFTADGRVMSSVLAHLARKAKELNKFLIFLATNYDAPFVVKKKVFDAAFRSSILYGCESWLKMSMKPVEAFYIKAVKALLGVRVTTPTSLCLIEAGLRPVKGVIKNRQKKFFNNMMDSRKDLEEEDPLMHILSRTRNDNRVMWTYIQSIITGGDFVADEINGLKDGVRTATPGMTKFRTYLSVNPMLDVHPLYTKGPHNILDHLRINFSRLRLSSHRLKVETGRWNRTPRENRLCLYNEGIQDEHHIFACPLVDHIFSQYGKRHYLSIADLFTDTDHTDLKMLNDIFRCLYAEPKLMAS